MGVAIDASRRALAVAISGGLISLLASRGGSIASHTFRCTSTLLIDTVGLGSGVFDRLKEVGTGNTRLVAFNGGAAAWDKANHVNAIAEAWWRMREWFLGGEADIEDDGALIGQVSSRGYSIQSDRRIKLQGKEELPKSPDEADGLAMTFAPSRGRANLTWI